jgi:phage N-6-adenine-methyltransferase
MVMPVQKPGRSEQAVGTPWQLMHACEMRWGKFTYDLAANDDGSNTKAPLWIGPTEDSLSVDWHKLGGLLWLNPEFGNIGPWAAKWKLEARLGARGIMLTPAAVSTEWYANHVHGEARVVAIRPRVKFIGHKQGFPKDIMLTLWGPGFNEPPFSIWRYL